MQRDHWLDDFFRERPRFGAIHSHCEEQRINLAHRRAMPANPLVHAVRGTAMQGWKDHPCNRREMREIRDALAARNLCERREREAILFEEGVD
jgi:hypothetical protein